MGKKGGRAQSVFVQVVWCEGRGGTWTACLQPPIALSAPLPPLHTFQVGCMNNTVHCYRADGHKAFSLYMPDRVISMQVGKKCGGALGEREGGLEWEGRGAVVGVQPPPCVLRLPACA